MLITELAIGTTACANNDVIIDVIATDIGSLNNIAVNNEKTVHKTLELGNEVNDIVSSVNQMSVEVSSSANEMAEVVSKFNM